MTTVMPSQHPGAVKARRWRERKRLEHRGCVFIHLPVTSAQIRALRRLALLPGDPDDWRSPKPDPEALAQAVTRYLAAAEPLAKVAGAFCSATDRE